MAVTNGVRVGALPDLGAITDDTTFVGYKGGVGDVTALGLGGYVRSDVSFYGAKGDGTTDDTAAILAMQAAAERVVFPAGTFRIPATTTITVPMTFAPGAKLTIDNGAILYMEGRYIDAPRQTIFAGAGVVRMRKAGVTLGNTAFPEWWGPIAAGEADDCAPVLQKMSDAHASLTEWHATMIGGLYQLKSGVTWGRGTYLQGLSNKRRVVFRLEFTAGDVFTTTDQACRFEGLQFECHDFIQRTSGATINCAHTATEVVDCSPEGYIGVRLGAPFCVVRDTTVGFRDSQTATGGAGILVDGPLCEVFNIRGTSHDAASAVVRLTGNAQHANIEQIRSYGSLGVVVDVIAGDGAFLTNVRIRNVTSRDGHAFVVRVANVGTGSIWNTVIDGVSVGPLSSATGVLIQNNSTGNVTRTLISNVVTRANLNGIVLDRPGAGPLDRVGISMCMLNLCTNKVVQGAGTTNVVLANTVFQ